jgi:hypothetical protein
MRDDEATTDQPAASKQSAQFFRMRAGGDIEVLRLDAGEQIANTAADQIAFVARIFQRIENPERAGGDPFAGDGMAVPWNPVKFSNVVFSLGRTPC